MTQPEHDPPFPMVSRREDRERVLAEALAHAAAQDSAFRRPSAATRRANRWKASLALLLLALAAYVGVRPPSWLAPTPIPTLRPGEVVRGQRATLYLDARQIELFRLIHGHVPRSLGELPVRASGVTFVRSNDRVYQLVTLEPDGVRLVYDSAKPAPGFAAVAAGWAGSSQPR